MIKRKLTNLPPSFVNVTNENSAVLEPAILMASILTTYLVDGVSPDRINLLWGFSALEAVTITS